MQSIYINSTSSFWPDTQINSNSLENYSLSLIPSPRDIPWGENIINAIVEAAISQRRLCKRHDEEDRRAITVCAVLMQPIYSEHSAMRGNNACSLKLNPAFEASLKSTAVKHKQLVTHRAESWRGQGLYDIKKILHTCFSRIFANFSFFFF